MIVLPIAFNTSFALLGLSFDYPDILRRPTSRGARSIPRRAAAALVLLWWSFALSALLFAPLVVLLSRSHRRRRRDPARGRDDDRSARLRRAVPRARPLAVPRPVPRSRRGRARCEPGPARGGRRRLPVLQPLPRRRRRRAPRLPADGRLERARGRGPARRRVEVPSWLGVVGIVVGAVLMLCSLEFVGRLRAHRLEARRRCGAVRLHRLVALADRHGRRAHRLSVARPRAARSSAAGGRGSISPTLA